MTDERLDQILKQALTPEIKDEEIMVHRKVRKKRMGKATENRRKHMSFSAAAAIAIIALAAMSGTVYAVGRHFGLFDFTEQVKESLPEDAMGLIEKDVEQTVADSTDGAIMDCTVREALCDSEVIMLVYEVSAKDAGKYLFIPEDASPEDDMSEWSDIRGISADEYAKRNELQIVNIGGGIGNRDELGIIESSMSFRSVEDDTIAVYVRAGKQSDVKNLNVSCLATARLYGSDNVMRNEIKFTLEDMSQAVSTRYMPRMQNAGNSVFEVMKAEVIQTELGTYVDVFYKNLQEEDRFYKTGVRLADKNGDEMDYIEGSGVEFMNDGSCRERFIMNKRQIEDTFSVQMYDYEENIVCETIEMEKQ